MLCFERTAIFYGLSAVGEIVISIRIGGSNHTETREAIHLAI